MPVGAYLKVIPETYHTRGYESWNDTCQAARMKLITEEESEMLGYNNIHNLL